MSKKSSTTLQNTNNVVNEDGNDSQEYYDVFTYELPDGTVIAPEDETNFLMALEVEKLIAQEEKEADEKKKKTSTAATAAAASSSSSKTETEKQQQEEMNFTRATTADLDIVFKTFIFDKEQETKEDEEEETTQQQDQKQQEQEKQQQKHEVSNDEEENEEEEYFEGDDESSMQEGMINSQSAEYFEREETDASSWILDKILLRKSVSLKVEDQDEDYDVEDDDPHAVGHSATSKKKQKKEFSYLCSWRGGRIKTWELRSVLEEDGFTVSVFEYDQKIKAKGIQAAKERTEAYKQTMYPNQVAARSGRGPRGEKRVAGGVLSSHQLFFQNLFPNWQADIAKDFAKDNLVAVRIVNIAPKEASERFIAALKEAKAKEEKTGGGTACDLRIAYHGTSDAGIMGIVNIGFVVPVAGNAASIRVANGSAFGIGVYSSLGGPGISTGYTRNMYSSMFVCAAICSRASIHGSYGVFKDSSFICPMFLVQFQHGGGGNSRLPEVNFNFHDFLRKTGGSSGLDSQSGDGVSATKNAHEKKKIVRMKRRVLEFRNAN